MKAIQDSSVEEFLRHAGPLLYQDEPTNSLMLGLCGIYLRSKEQGKLPPILVRVELGGRTVSAAMQTPPMNLVVTYADLSQVQCIANYLCEIKAQFPGVVGPKEAAELFADFWSQLSGKNAKLGMGQKIYKIEKVKIPEVEGSLCWAQPQEADLVARWLFEFSEESLPIVERKSLAERRVHAAKAIENRMVYLWVVDKKPVSVAHISRPTQNGISLGAVYTPKPLRKKGYASAVVAHLSQTMLDTGKKFCVLYTDIANPTSNKIYQDIGYREVSDSKHFLFEAQLS